MEKLNKKYIINASKADQEHLNWCNDIHNKVNEIVDWINDQEKIMRELTYKHWYEKCSGATKRPEKNSSLINEIAELKDEILTIKDTYKFKIKRILQQINEIEILYLTNPMRLFNSSSEINKTYFDKIREIIKENFDVYV